MAIVKVTDASQVYLEEHPYTQIFNDVIVHIKDSDAFRMYCYLSSKSREWKVAKKWTSEQCGVGIRKAKQCWSYLERCGLLEYIGNRDENGKFTYHDIRILNGTRFNKDEPFLKPIGAETAPVEKLSTETPHHWCNNPPSGETTRVDFAPQLKKENTNKDFDTKKRKSFCASAQKKATALEKAAPEKTAAPKTASPKTKDEWREENAKRHDFADKMDNAVVGKQQME